MSTSKRLYIELTRDEVMQNINENSILCLPIGATEQHGPHLPLNTDTILAREFAERIVSMYYISYDLWLLPCLEYGLSPEHKWSCGTISLSIELFVKLLNELMSELITAQPARNVLIINGHGGNRGVLETLIQEFRNKYSVWIAVIHPSSLSRVKSESSLSEVHGGKSETSMILEFSPELVKTDSIPKSFEKSDQIDVGKYILDRAVSWPWNSNDNGIAFDGIIGDASTASAELGKKIIDSTIKNSEEVIVSLIEYGKSIRKT